jgi:hypothetical protein
MTRYFTLAMCAALLLVLSLPALADSDSFSNVQLKGASGTVSGSFTFSNGTFSNLSLSFKDGVFGVVNAFDASGGKGQQQGQWYVFTWKTKVGKDWVWNKVSFDPSNGQYHESGWIANRQDKGKFNLQVPEGGTPLSYLVLSGLAVFAGILMSGKRRRTTRSAESA